MKLMLPKGATSVSVDVFIRDSSQTDGRGLTGLVYNTSNLVAYYRRPGAAAAQITLATLADATASWSSGGFVQVDATNMPGLYRLDIPDAVLASGVNQAYIMLKGAANMEPCVIEIQLTSINVNDATRGGMAALPNAAAEALGGLYTRGSGAGQINQDANGRVDVNIEAIDTDDGAAATLESYTDGTTPIPANVTQNAGSAIVATGGRQEVNVSHFGGSAGTFASGIPAINLVQWRGNQPANLTSTRVEVLLGACSSGVIDAAAIATDAIGSAEISSAAVTKIADGIKAAVIEAQGSITLQQALSVILAVLAGETENSGNTFLSPNGGATRVAATTNGSNERTAIVLTPSS